MEMLNDKHNVVFSHAGLTLSLGVGPGHYCDLRNLSELTKQAADMLSNVQHEERKGDLVAVDDCARGGSPARAHIPRPQHTTTTMEVAVFTNGEWYRLRPEEAVQSWIPVSKLPSLLGLMMMDAPLFDRAEAIRILLDNVRSSMEGESAS
jgi:hypothetical protein